MMSGRAHVTCLPSRFARLLKNEVRVSCQLSQRDTHTYIDAHLRDSPTHHPLRRWYQGAVVPVPSLCRSAVTVSPHQPGRIKRFIKKMGWLDHSRSKLKRSGYILYENVCEQVLTSDFFEVCELPDTFYSWFLVTELHMWLVGVRIMAEGEEGRYTRNSMIEALWQDADARSKRLGAVAQSIRQEQMQVIGWSFQAAMLSYDEGITSDDRVLASALWRQLFSKACEDPERLECVVNYVRRQTAMLDSLSRSELLMDCQVKWVPLLERES